MKLTDYLQHFNISQQAFAEQIGVTQTAVGRYAAHRRMPRPIILKRIVEKTGGAVTADDFFAEVEVKPKRVRRMKPCAQPEATAV